MKTLTIRLTAPLQSYGDEASFSRRTTHDAPSKSAIVGLLAAALGYRRTDTRIKQLAQLEFAVRTDQPGAKMTEFQTVEWKKDTRKLTYRDFIQDAVYVVAVGSEDGAQIDALVTALRHPKFQLYLGRRSNPPAGPLKLSTYDDQNPVEVLSKLDWQAAEWYQKRVEQLDAEIIADANLLPEKQGRTVMVKDRPESFDQRDRRFTYREVATKRITLGAKNENTEHDIWGAI